MSGEGANAEQVPHEVTQGIVAYLDVLGTRGVTSQKDALEHARRIRGLHKFIDDQIGGISGLIRAFFAVLARTPLLSTGNVAQFSDSMFLWVPLEPGNEFLTLSDLTSVLVRVFHYGLKNRLPLRGAVSIGPFVVDEGIFVGEAVAEAVDWERIGDWSGVILAPSATSLVIRELQRGNGYALPAEFAWAKVPTKGSSVPSGTKLMVLAWPNVGLSKLRERLEGMYLSAPLPVDVAVKWIHTMDFVDYVTDQVRAGKIEPPNMAYQKLIGMIWDGRESSEPGNDDSMETVSEGAIKRPSSRPPTTSRETNDSARG